MDVEIRHHSFDQDGMRTDLLESRLRMGIKFIYVLPISRTPTG